IGRARSRPTKPPCTSRTASCSCRPTPRWRRGRPREPETGGGSLMSTPAGSSFAGDIGAIGLFDLGQLLMMNRATGCLAVTSDSKRGSLYFREGQIVNAVDDEYHDGEGAAYKVFAWRTGRFEFRSEAVAGASSIHVKTESLMLEA